MKLLTTSILLLVALNTIGQLDVVKLSGIYEDAIIRVIRDNKHLSKDDVVYITSDISIHPIILQDGPIVQLIKVEQEHDIMVKRRWILVYHVEAGTNSTSYKEGKETSLITIHISFHTSAWGAKGQQAAQNHISGAPYDVIYIRGKKGQLIFSKLSRDSI